MSTSAAAWPAGYDKLVLAEVDSTNAQAARLAATLSGPTWILARRQTAGRARRGRDWVDPAGNFAATLLMRPRGGLALRALRSFVAALALYEALVAASGRGDGLTLKWPNDVLLNGRKLAGILLESGAQDYLAVGIGVNLRAVPPMAALEAGARPPVDLLSATGARVTAAEFLDLLAPAFARWETQLTTFGFAPLRAAWLARAAHLGQRISARVGTARYEGRFETLDAHGALVLNTADGRRAISAGEVFFQ